MQNGGSSADIAVRPGIFVDFSYATFSGGEVSFSGAKFGEGAVLINGEKVNRWPLSQAVEDAMRRSQNNPNG